MVAAQPNAEAALEAEGSSARTVEALGLVADVAARVGRRAGLPPAEVEDLASALRIKVLEDGGRALRDFRGSCSLRTYLTVLAQRVVVDEQVRRWGRWRPSAEARREGPMGVELERLLARDRLGFEAAWERLRLSFPEAADRERLRALATRLPAHAVRVFVADEEAAALEDPRRNPESEALERERTDWAADVAGKLRASVSELPARDRLILRMRFEQGLQLSQIARLLGIEQRPLYRALEALLRDLRKKLLDRGVEAGRIAAVLAESGLVSEIGPDRENERPGPSLGAEERLAHGESD